MGGTLEIRKCLWVLILTQLFLNGMAFTKFINRKPLCKTRLAIAQCLFWLL